MNGRPAQLGTHGAAHRSGARCSRMAPQDRHKAPSQAQAPIEGGRLGRLALEALDALLVGGAAVLAISALVTLLGGCSPAQRGAAIDVGSQAANCAAGAAWTCTGATVLACGLPDVLSAGSWSFWWDCATAVGPECAAERGLDCAGLAVATVAGHAGMATTTAALHVDGAVQDRAEACLSRAAFKEACQGPETCAAALAACLEAALQPDT